MASSDSLSQFLQQQHSYIHRSRPAVAGHLVRVVGLTLEATGCSAAIGQPCSVQAERGDIEAFKLANGVFPLLESDSISIKNNLKISEALPFVPTCNSIKRLLLRISSPTFRWE